MGDISLFEWSIVLAFAAYAVFGIGRMFLRRCRDCNARMKLDSLRDPRGVNFGRYFSISFYNGPGRQVETYKCGACGTVEVVNAAPDGMHRPTDGELEMID